MDHITYKPNKLLNKSIYAAITIAMFFMGLITFWQFYPYSLLVANTQPFQLIDQDKVLKAGDLLEYRIDTCANYTGHVEVNRILVNDIYTEFTPSTNYIQKGECFNRTNQSVVLPTSLPNGKYHLEIIISAQVNPVRTASVRFITEEFEVRNPVLELNERVEKLEDCFGLICPVLP